MRIWWCGLFGKRYKLCAKRTQFKDSRLRGVYPVE